LLYCIVLVAAVKSTWDISSQVLFNPSRRQFFPSKPPP